MIIYDSFTQLYENEVISLIKKNPDWIRLDGAISGGNREIFAKFKYKGKTWKIHSDTHIEKLKNAYKMLINGEDPFVEKYTKDKSLTLDLKNNKGYKHLYIYLIKS